MNGKKPRIVVLPIASEVPEERKKVYTKAFARLGHAVDVIVINEDKKELDDKKNIDLLEKADGLFISGGDQVRLRKYLIGTNFLQMMRDKYRDEEFVIAGTSAGAMILSEHMINTGSRQESISKGIIQLDKGFGFLPRTIIDTHFFNRGRFARLTEALLIKQNCTGIGIGEDTALVVTDGDYMRAIGSGTVIIIENDGIKNTNYDKVKDKEPVYIECLKVHILSRGAAYYLKEQKFVVL
jgi:cyanophycinase